MTEEGRGVVIIGAGFGGLVAARKLVRASVPFTLIDKRNHHLFQPLLYQVATAALSPADIAVPVRSILGPRGHARAEVMMDEVVDIDTDAKTVRTAGGGQVPYSDLIVATGARYTYFGHESDWQEHAPSLKTLDDAVNIRRRVLLAFERAETTRDPELRRRLMTFVVIGGGPTGVETAGALAELARATLAKDFTNIDTRAARVVLVEALDKVLNGYPERLSEYARRRLEQIGVEVQTGSPVEDITAEGVLLDGNVLDAANVFWCAGVVATPVGEWLGVKTERNGTIRVGEDLKLPGHDNLFVIGDAATVMGPDGKPLPALAPAAKQQGAYVAEAIIRQRNSTPPQAAFRYRDWGTLATIGRSSAVGKFGKLELTGFPAWLVWGVVHVAYLVGFRNRLSVMLNWLWAWATYAKGARLITGPDEASVVALDSVEAVKDELDMTVTNLEQSASS